MTQTAKVILDSISPEGKRLCTLQTRHFRMIHAEFMTHRKFSRNASSSRAIPVARMIEDIRRDPAMPVFWGSNQPGMQAGEEITGDKLDEAKHVWLDTMEYSITSALQMVECGLHKQIANRILEPWMHINVVVSATSYDNWFNLRNHPDAQPEIKDLAVKMLEAMEDSTPQELQPGEWHLPYYTPEDTVTIENMITGNGAMRVVPMPEQINDYARKISVARCARVSYLTHDGRKTSVEEDVALFEKLLVSQPLHASPAEHQATPDRKYFDTGEWVSPDLHGNFEGWCQYRRMLPGGIV